MSARSAGASLAGSLVVVGCAALLVQACSDFGVASAPTTDAGGDAPASVVPTADGGAETGVVGTGFCAMHGGAALCSDFDGADPLKGWKLDQVGGTLQTVATYFLSEPRSLLTRLQGNMTTSARLAYAIPKGARRVRLSFAFRRGGSVLQPGQEMSIAEIYCNPDSSDEGAYIFLQEPSFDVVAHSGDNASTATSLSPLRDKDWTPIVLDARFDATPPTADIMVNGTQAQRVTITQTCATAPVFEVRLGASTYTSALQDAYFDDVLLELDPP